MNDVIVAGFLFRVVGISLPEQASPVTLMSDGLTTVTIAHPSNDLCRDLEMGPVLAEMILRGQFGDGGRDPSHKFLERLELELGASRANRQPQDVLLLIETKVRDRLDLTRFHREHDGIVAGFDLYDKVAVRAHHDTVVSRLIAGLTCIAHENVDVHRLASGTYAISDDGKRYYSHTPTANPPRLPLVQTRTGSKDSRNCSNDFKKGRISTRS